MAFRPSQPELPWGIRSFYSSECSCVCAGLVLAAPVLQQAAAMINAAVFHRTTVLASLGLAAAFGLT